MEDLYFNLTSKQIIRRVYPFLFSDDQLLDGRYFPSLVLSSGQFNRINSLEIPLNYVSNQIPIDVIKQHDVQQITFSGKLTRLSAEKILKDYWQNPIKQGLNNVQIIIIELQEYLSYSSNEFYTTITYIVSTFNGESISSACFNPSLIEPTHSSCNRENKYLAQIPVGFLPSFVDLKGNYSENFAGVMMSALQGKGKLNAQISNRYDAFLFDLVSSVLTELRFGLDMSLITRIYYSIVPQQLITEEQLKVRCSIFSDLIIFIH